MKSKSLFLSIASFTIKLVFIKSIENNKYENEFIRTIIEHFKHFIIKATNKKPDYTIELIYDQYFRILRNNDQEDVFISFYKQISPSYVRSFYHISGSQLQILLRKITHELLAKHNGFILHASASNVNGKAVLFLGKSGAGKSTAMSMLSMQFPPLGDDTVIIKEENKKFYCYSSTASEKNDWFRKDKNKLSLKALCFLKKSVYNKLALIEDKNQCLELLEKQIYSEKDNLSEQMRSLLKFVSKYDNFYYLKFNLTNPKELAKLIERI